MKEVLMMQGAGKLVGVCGAVKEGEKVVIVTDFNLINIAKVMASAVHERNAEVVIVSMAPRKMHNEELPRVVAAAMKEADVIFAPTTYTIAHTKARTNATDKGARVINMPDYREEVLMSDALLGLDLKERAPVVKKVAKMLTEAKEAHVTSALGTDVKLGLEGRQGYASTGLIHEPGQFGTPPDIEARITPVEGTSEGTIVVDGSIPVPGVSLLREPITVTVRKGFAQDIKGGEQAKRFADILKKANDPNVYNIAELGIGLNPKAQLKGIMVEDEGMLGTIHIAVGTSGAFGGKIRTSLHLDMIIRNPTVKLDNKIILLENGQLMVE